MNTKSLKQFLVDSNRAGYVTGEEKQWTKETDSSTTIPFEKGKWKSHDNFFGGEPYGGRIIVSYENKPVWMMVYYGWVEEGTDSDTVYAILRSALKQMPKDCPYRGPEKHKQGEFEYTNSWEGEVERYSGSEQITQNGRVIYKADYMGGLVDQRKGI